MCAVTTCCEFLWACSFLRRFLVFILHSGSYTLSTLSSSVIPEPWEEGCDIDVPFMAGHSRVSLPGNQNLVYPRVDIMLFNSLHHSLLFSVDISNHNYRLRKKEKKKGRRRDQVGNVFFFCSRSRCWTKETTSSRYCQLLMKSYNRIAGRPTQLPPLFEDSGHIHSVSHCCNQIPEKSNIMKEQFMDIV